MGDQLSLFPRPQAPDVRPHFDPAPPAPSGQLKKRVIRSRRKKSRASKRRTFMRAMRLCTFWGVMLTFTGAVTYGCVAKIAASR